MKLKVTLLVWWADLLGDAKCDTRLAGDWPCMRQHSHHGKHAFRDKELDIYALWRGYE